MLVRRAVATVALVGLLSTPSRALAQALTLTPSASAAAGYAASDTIPNDPKLPPTIRAAPYVSVSPSFGLTLETPRTLQTIESSLVGAVPLAFSSNYTGPRFEITGRATYTGRFDLSELWTLNTGVALSAIPANPLVAAVDAYSTPVDQAFQSLAAYNLSVSGYATFTRDLTPESRLIQTTDVLYSFPFNDEVRGHTNTLSTRGSVAYTHQLPLDAFTGTLSALYTHFGVAADSATRDQILTTLVGTWNHDLTPTLATSVDLGVLMAASPVSDAQLWHPTGGARLTYTFDPATASIGYTHGAQINVFTSTLNLTDQAILRASLPIGLTGIGLSASGGYTRLTPIPTDAKLSGSTNIVAADLGVTYSPPAVPRLAAIVRGIYNRQIPVGNPLSGFTRLAFNVSLAFSLPDTRVAQVHQIVAPAYTPTPILSSDSTPAPGVQPAPIELIEPPAENSGGAQAPGAGK